jgi:hypothetical protein
MPLHPLDDAKVPFCAGSECLQRLFVIFAFVGSQRSFVTFKFNNNSPLLKTSFVWLDSAQRSSQKTPAK